MPPLRGAIWNSDEGKLTLHKIDLDDKSLIEQLETASRDGPIKELIVSNNPRITRFDVIGQRTSLEVLDLGDTGFADEHIESCLRPLANLQVLAVWGSKFTIEGVKQLASLKLPQQELCVQPEKLNNAWVAALGQFAWLHRLLLLEASYCRAGKKAYDQRRRRQSVDPSGWSPTPAARKLKEALPNTRVTVNHVKIEQ